jgi:hypothetical protein
MLVFGPFRNCLSIVETEWRSLVQGARVVRLFTSQSIGDVAIAIDRMC